MSKESQLWAWLKGAQKSTLEGGPTRVDLRRVEDAMGAGFPDVDGVAVLGEPVGPPLCFKLELKSEVRPKRSATPIRFKVEKRFAQLEFLRKRYGMGENAYFLLQVGEGADRKIYLAPGDLGEALKVGLTEAQLAFECVKRGYLFPKNVKPLDVIIGVAACSARR